MEVTIRLDESIERYLEEWRNEYLIDAQKRIAEEKNEKVAKALFGNYQTIERAGYEFLIKMYLSHQAHAASQKGK